MNAIDKIINWQNMEQLDDFQAANRIGISESLFFKVIHGYPTHPNIANKIADICGLNELEAEELMPKNRRPHGGCYEPDKYVRDVDIFRLPSKESRIESIV